MPVKARLKVKRWPIITARRKHIEGKERLMRQLSHPTMARPSSRKPTVFGSNRLIRNPEDINI